MVYMVKLESKDIILVRVWHRNRVYPLSLACYELTIYDHVDGSVLLSFSCSGFALMLFCMCVLSLPIDMSRSRGRHL
jgi:hypothetical protein